MWKQILFGLSLLIFTITEAFFVRFIVTMFIKRDGPGSLLMPDHNEETSFPDEELPDIEREFTKYEEIMNEVSLIGK